MDQNKTQQPKKKDSDPAAKPGSTGGNGQNGPPQLENAEEVNEALGGDPGRPIEVITQAMQEAEQRKLSALIEGKLNPPNKFVKYLVDRVREGNQEFQMVQQNIQQLNQRLAQLQKRMIQLQGEQVKYVQDIKYWLNPHPAENEEDTDG